MAPRHPLPPEPMLAEYIVPPNTEGAKLQAGFATTARDLVVVVAFGSALLGFVSKHDLAGGINFLQSSAALPALALIVGVGTSAYRFVMSRRHVKITALAADPATTDRVTVKGS